MYYDQTLGFDLSIMAVASGARVIEKHITLSRKTVKKAEHHFSLEPEEFRDLVVKIRNSEIALGSTHLKRSREEVKFRIKARRSLHVNKSMGPGRILKVEDIDIVRPADGAVPELCDYFIGKKLKRFIKAWSPLHKEDVV